MWIFKAKEKVDGLGVLFISLFSCVISDLTGEKEKDKHVNKNDISYAFSNILLLSIWESTMTASVCFE